MVDKKKEYDATAVMENEEIVISSAGANSCTMELTVVGLESIDLPGYVPVEETVDLEATTDTEGYEWMVEWYEKDEAGELNELSNSVSWDNPGETTVVARLEQKYTKTDDEEVVMIGESLEHSITAFEVTNIVIAEESEDTPPLYIDAETKQMPEVTFEFQIEPENIPAAKIEADWFIEMAYDEGNYSSFADNIIGVPAIAEVTRIERQTTWTPEWPVLTGSKATYVEVYVKVEGSEEDHANKVNGSWKIKGENPSVEQIQNYTANDFEYAMFMTESADFSGVVTPNRPHQFFDGKAIDVSQLPLRSFDNGWGLGQLTMDPPTREQVWSWEANVIESLDGTRRFRDVHTTKRSGAISLYEAAQDDVDIPNWLWNPTDENDVFVPRDPDFTQTHDISGQDVETVMYAQTYLFYNAGMFLFGHSSTPMFENDGSLRQTIQAGTWQHVRNYLGNL